MQIPEQFDAGEGVVTKQRHIAVVPFLFVKKLVVDESMHVTRSSQRILRAAEDVPIVHVSGIQYQTKRFDTCVM